MATKRYSIPNGNGTYRIPIGLINGVGEHLRIEGDPPCLFGPLANLVGQAEDLGDLEELKQLIKRVKRNRTVN